MCNIFHRHKHGKEGKTNNEEYIEVFAYLLFGLFPVTPWLVCHCTDFAERFAYRRTYRVRRDRFSHLQGLQEPQVLNGQSKTKGGDHEKAD
jgi:hypothetical protein